MTCPCPARPRPTPLWRRVARCVAAAGLLLAGAPVWADEAAPPAVAALAEQISGLAREGARQGAPAAARVEVEVGSLDPRLKLAPCQRIEPYLPNGMPAWGRTRVGLRCVHGAKAWNVSLPVTVHVWARGWVATGALPVGTVLDASQFSEAEVDLAAAPGTAVQQLPQVLGRTLARALPAGQALRATDLKARQWFAAGETVKLVAVGPGWRIVSEGQAVSPGLEGQTARVRTDSGRILQGRPVGDREVEVAL